MRKDKETTVEGDLDGVIAHVIGGRRKINPPLQIVAHGMVTDLKTEKVYQFGTVTVHLRSGKDVWGTVVHFDGKTLGLHRYEEVAHNDADLVAVIVIPVSAIDYIEALASRVQA